VSNGLPITTKMPPMMITVLTSWNILVDAVAGCGGWLGDCRSRLPVMNARNLRIKSILVGKVGKEVGCPCYAANPLPSCLVRFGI